MAKALCTARFLGELAGEHRGRRVAAMFALGAIALGGASARAGLMANFEGTGASAADPTFDFGTPNSNGYVPDPGTAATVTLTPDNTTASQGSNSLKIAVSTGGFHFGTLRWDHGAVNSHEPQWIQPANDTLLFDVRVLAGGFTDFLTIRPSYIPSGSAGGGGTVDGPDFPLQGLADGNWHTLQWVYPNSAAQMPPPGNQGFWIEWFSTNSNGPVTMWVDNIRTASTVPEPASLLAAVPALVGVTSLRRRPRRRV